MKEKYIDLYMDFASRVAELSHAKRLKVGAVIVNDDTVVFGYNGMPAGWDNNCEDKIFISPWREDLVEEENVTYTLKTKPEVLHAESNAISKLARSVVSGQGADIFITHSPCLECSKLILQAGITRVFYKTQYRDDTGLKFLEKSNVKVVKIERHS